jgi:hypothetical protein
MKFSAPRSQWKVIKESEGSRKSCAFRATQLSWESQLPIKYIATTWGGNKGKECLGSMWNIIMWKKNFFFYLHIFCFQLVLKSVLLFSMVIIDFYWYLVYLIILELAMVSKLWNNLECWSKLRTKNIFDDFFLQG